MSDQSILFQSFSIVTVSLPILFFLFRVDARKWLLRTIRPPLQDHSPTRSRKVQGESHDQLERRLHASQSREPSRQVTKLDANSASLGSFAKTPTIAMSPPEGAIQELRESQESPSTPKTLAQDATLTPSHNMVRKSETHAPTDPAVIQRPREKSQSPQNSTSASTTSQSMPPPPRPTVPTSSSSKPQPALSVPTLSSNVSNTARLASNTSRTAARQPSSLAPPTSNSNSLRPQSTPTTSTLPAQNRPRQKVTLAPGHSPLDWAHLTSTTSPHVLSGVRGLQRVTPTQLKDMNGRKGKPAWSVFRGKVYNISPYMDFHPGGVGELRRGAGKVGDKLFDDVHSWVNVDGMLGNCLVGVMVSENEVSPGEDEGLEGLD